MATFGEALLKEQLWYWLETSKGMEVEGEVTVEDGRIDLVAKSPDDEFWGIELKKGEFSSYEQANRYIESGSLDRLYIASDQVDRLQQSFVDQPPINVGTVSQTCKRLCAGVAEGCYSKNEVMAAVDRELPESFLKRQLSGSPSIRQYIQERLVRNNIPSKKPLQLDDAITYLLRARCPTEVGVIHIPLNLTDRTLRDVERALTPKKAYEPRILRDATQLDRERKLTFARDQEPWVRHCVWREYGGLPEGHVPNVMSSDQPYRPIDLIAFDGSYDPTDAVKNPDEYEVIGIEAKGKGSFSPAQVVQQLSEYLKTQSLSRLYLTVPKSISNKAIQLLTSKEVLKPVGLVSVAEDGTVRIEQEATKIQPEYDGYLEQYSKRKVGYGEIEIESGKDIISPYITDEEAERLKHSDAAEYARDILTDNSTLADADEWIRDTQSEPTRPPESEFNQGKVRSYLLTGQSADPYTSDSSQGIEPDDMKPGYVRLTVTYFTVDDQDALKLHFGRGSWEGGYIWFVGTEVDKLQSILASLETIAGGEVAGQGKVLDLQKYPFDNAKNEPHCVSGRSGKEVGLKLRFTTVMEDDIRARIRLGGGEKAGVDVTLTELQWFDLVATVDIIRTGNPRELPGEYSHPRIGPSGKNTWSIGTEIEKAVYPDPPSEWD